MNIEKPQKKEEPATQRLADWCAESSLGAHVETLIREVIELAEMRGEKIKAAPHQFPQCLRFLCEEGDRTIPCTCWKQMP